MADNNLGNEWKDTVYNLGGAFFGLGKTIIHSVKKGVDVAYDYFNEEDAKKKKAGTAKKRPESESVKPETVEAIVIEEE